MIDLLVYSGMGLLFYIVYCLAANQPIIRTKKNLSRHQNKKRSKIEDANDKLHADILTELDPVTFDNFFENVLDIKDGIIISENDWYSKIIEVSPVNYYLRDTDEQEQIDKNFETWTANLDGLLPRIYYQNRFIDLTENTELIEDTFNNQSGLPPEAIEYGKYMLEDLNQFQSDRPRYELKIYLIFDYQVKKTDLRIEDDDDVQIATFEKAESELNRAIQKAQNLTKSGNSISELDTAGITELHYHLFQRRRARKLRFNDIQKQEMLAMYITSSQTPEHMAAVKEEIDNVAKAEAGQEKTESNTTV